MQEITTKILKTEEKGITRELWETVFTEDSSSFLDYYYSEKTKDNQIYVLERDNQIASMVHLNPYTMRIGKESFPTHYIVAVATREQYRKQGMMARLLNRCLSDMYEKKEPFTFLMPASEAIYTPFDFRTVIHFPSAFFIPEQLKCAEVEIGEGTKEDWDEVVSFVNDYLECFPIAIFRNRDYYERWKKELESEDGHVIVARKNGKVCAVFGYAKGSMFEIREPIFQDEKEFLHALYRLFQDEKVHLSTMQIMIRVVHLETFLNAVFKEGNGAEKIHIKDSIIKENTATYCWKDGVWKKRNLEILEEDAKSISEFMEEICAKYWNKIFINEVV